MLVKSVVRLTREGSYHCCALVVFCAAVRHIKLQNTVVEFHDESFVHTVQRYLWEALVYIVEDRVGSKYPLRRAAAEVRPRRQVVPLHPKFFSPCFRPLNIATVSPVSVLVQFTLLPGHRGVCAFEHIAQGGICHNALAKKTRRTRRAG